MGQYVLSNLQNLKVMNMSCTTSSANVCLVLSAGWVAGAGRARTQYISQASQLCRDDMVRDAVEFNLFFNYYFPTLNIQGKLRKENLFCWSS